MTGSTLPDLTDISRDDGGQTVRLSGDLGFPDGVCRVRILRDGPRRVLVPAEHGWDRWYDRATQPGTTRLGVARELAIAGIAALRRFAARPEAAPVLLVVLFALVGAMFAFRAWAGLTTLEFGDETEKYVAAQMMRRGHTLYGDIYANHGPLAYLIAWGETFLFGVRDFSRARLAVVLLAVVAIAAMMGATRMAHEDLRQGWRPRVLTGVLFAAPLSALWFVHPMHMLIYHALDGYLITIMLGLLVVPSILGRNVARWACVASGVAGMGAFLAAYPAAVPATLCVMAAAIAVGGKQGWREAWRMVRLVAAGAAIAAVPMVPWLSLHASWKGYLAYHFYLNQVVYSRMFGFGALSFLHALDLSAAPSGRAHAYAIMLGGLGLAALAAVAAWRRAWAAMLAVLPACGAVLMLNFKGSPDFPDAAQMIACLALFAAGTVALLSRIKLRSTAPLLVLVLGVIVSAELVARTSLMSPYATPRSQAFQRIIGPLPNDPLFAELRRLIPPGETLLAMPFWPVAYINAERLPASGQYYYIPLQAEYDRAPVLGASLDFCGDILRNRPRAMIILSARPGSPGDLLTYKPCFGEILNRDYVARPEFGGSEAQPTLWQRRDTLPAP